MMPKETVTVTFFEKSFDIDVSFSNGNIIGIEVDAEFQSLILDVNTSETDDGEMEITLPRELIDARANGKDDDVFIVMVMGEEASFTEVETTPASRTIKVCVPAGTDDIEIIGNEIRGAASVGHFPSISEKAKEKYQTWKMLEEFQGETGEGRELVYESRWSEALQFFDESLQKYPKSVFFMFSKCEALAGLGRYEDALIYCDRIIETSDRYLTEYRPTFVDLGPITFDTLFFKCELLERLQRDKDVERSHDRIMEISETFINMAEKDSYVYSSTRWDVVWLSRARVFLRRGDRNNALVDLKRAFELHAHADIEGRRRFKDRIERDEDFDSIRNEEQFKALIEYLKI